MNLWWSSVCTAALVVGTAVGPSRAPTGGRCTCIATEDWRDIRDQATALFTGVVIADTSYSTWPFLPADSALRAAGADGLSRITLMVEHAWKLPNRAQGDSVLVSVWTPPGPSCGVYFKLGERYLVVAHSGARWATLFDSLAGTPGRTMLSAAGAGSLWTFQCAGTQPLARARRALDQLGPARVVADSVRRPPGQ
jgi:hypothetical protein